MRATGAYWQTALEQGANKQRRFQVSNLRRRVRYCFCLNGPSQTVSV